MTGFDLSVDGEPPADVEPSSVLEALLRSGRWSDAADYAADVQEVTAIDRARLLLCAGRVNEARLILSAEAAEHEDAPWLHFLQHLTQLSDGGVHSLPDLVSEAAQLPPHPLLPKLMLRAADIAARPDIAAHFGRNVQHFDVDAARAVAIDLIQSGEYIQAVQLLDRAEQTRCSDEVSPLQIVLERLRPSQAVALVTVGRYMHREKDPTKPITHEVREARRRWRLAYRVVRPPRLRRWLTFAVAAVAVPGSYFAVHNALPGFLIAIAVAAWLRSRPLPGLDPRSSRLVRALSDPRQVLMARRYRVIDVITFLYTLLALAVLASRQSGVPSWLGILEAVVVVLLAGIATRARRRWVRRRNTRLLPPPLDPAICRCLDLPSMHGRDARNYVEQHLFRVGVVPARSAWRLLQCLSTNSRFLDLVAVQLTIRMDFVPSDLEH